MSHQSPDAKTRRRWLFVVSFLLLLIAMPVAYRFVGGWMLESKLEQIHRELDAEDPHWRWRDHCADLPAPTREDRDAAKQVVKVADLLRKSSSGANGKWLNKRHSNARLLNETENALRAALAKVDAKALEEARRLKDMPEGCFAVEPVEDPREMKVPNDQLLPVLRVLQQDAILHAHDQKTAAAAESCQALLHAARVLNDPPTLMSFLMRTAGQELAVAALEFTLGQGEVSPGRLEELQRALAAEADSQGVYRCLRGERAYSHQLFALMRAGKVAYTDVLQNLRPTNKFEGFLYGYFPSMCLAAYPEHLRFENEVVRAAKLEDEARVDAFRKLIQKGKSSSNVLTRQWIFFLPALEDSQPVRARLRCAIVAVAAERFRLVKQEWPSSMDELVNAGLLAAVVKDPYDGQPLRLRATGTGLLIYSVGKNKIDVGANLNRYDASAWPEVSFELWDNSPNARHRNVAPAEIEKKTKKKK